MRWLTRSMLVGLATGLISQVQASCNGGANVADTPDSNALTFFATSTVSGVMTGNLINFNNGVGPTAGDTDGLTAGDHICTYYAQNPAGANVQFAAGSSTTQPYYNQDTSGNTVQFKAVLSTDSIDAVDRFASINNINIVDSASRKCLAANISDLFTGSSANNVYSTSNIFDQVGNLFSSGTQVWTGTGALILGTADKPGGRFHKSGQSVDPWTGFCRRFNGAFAWGNSSTVAQGAVGTLYDFTQVQNTPHRWINDDATSNGLLACSQGIRLYCLSAQAFAPAPPNVGGDPQFVGLQGQHFQVHGMPDEFFNLITTPEFQLNSRFTYLASGQCSYNTTQCWTHPGTYVDQLGFMFPGIQIKAIAGPHHKGLRVWVNDEEMSTHTKLRLKSTTSNNSTQTVTVRHPHHDTMIVTSSLYTIEITNSDWFFNFNLQFHVPEILAVGKMLHFIADSRPNHGAVDSRYPAYPMHGLVGQTWKNARYPAKRMYQGEIDDYMLMDHTLFSSQFGFNLYQY